MTRKHFQAIADGLKFAHPSFTAYGTPEARAAWRDCVLAMADVCKANNPRFDRDKFVAACTPEKHSAPVWKGHAPKTPARV